MYIVQADFGAAMAFFISHHTASAVGSNLDFVIHPNNGCSYPDHEEWSIRAGHTPNNMWGIAQEGGYTGDVASSIDPSADHSAAYCTVATPAVPAANLSVYAMASK